jgi:hypothetical protein
MERNRMQFATPRPPSIEVLTRVTLVLRGDPADLGNLLNALEAVAFVAPVEVVSLDATGFAQAFGAGNELGWEKTP